MAKTSGGVRGGGGNKRRRNSSSTGKTEKGYTKKMRKNILSMESRYRNNKDETLHVYGSSGNIITSFGGKGAEVRFNSKGIPENTILTHNHPHSIGASEITRIGNSFSKQDIPRLHDWGCVLLPPCGNIPGDIQYCSSCKPVLLQVQYQLAETAVPAN